MTQPPTHSARYKRAAFRKIVPIRLGLLLFALLFATSAFPAAPADGPTIIYRKVFKSSYPEYVQIKVSQNGAATYDIRQLDEESEPVAFEINPPLVQHVFELASKLHNFQGVDLDIHRRIANLGEKTFVYTKGTESHEVKFNYTVNPAASQLLQICEGLARQQELVEVLQRRMKYDRLGVNDALLELETDFSKGVLPEPQRLLPLLDQISADYRFVEIARQRARSLAEKIRHSG